MPETYTMICERLHAMSRELAEIVDIFELSVRMPDLECKHVEGGAMRLSSKEANVEAVDVVLENHAADEDLVVIPYVKHNGLAIRTEPASFKIHYGLCLPRDPTAIPYTEWEQHLASHGISEKVIAFVRRWFGSYGFSIYYDR